MERIQNFVKTDLIIHSSRVFVHKVTLYVDQYYLFKRLNTQLNESTNENSLESPKLLS